MQAHSTYMHHVTLVKLFVFLMKFKCSVFNLIRFIITLRSIDIKFAVYSSFFFMLSQSRILINVWLHICQNEYTCKVNIFANRSIYHNRIIFLYIYIYFCVPRITLVNTVLIWMIACVCNICKDYLRKSSFFCCFSS